MNDDNMKVLAKKLARRIVNAPKLANKNKPKPYDVMAKVRRVENGTAYIHIPGGIDETPVRMTINANAGDTVQVRVSGGDAWLVGNGTVPPTGDAEALLAKTLANHAKTKADVAEETAVVADENATSARTTAEAILVYDHTYTVNETANTAHFTAYLYRGGIDIKTKYDERLFTWALKTEAGETDLGYGYEITISLADCDYGAEVIGRFTEGDDVDLLDSHGANYTTESGQAITGRANGDEIRVRDLEVRTSISDIEKLLIVGTADEHLVTMNTLTSYLANRIDSDKHFVYTQSTPSDTWEIEHNLGKEPSVTVVDSAGTTVEGDCEYINTNKLIVSFSSAFSGKAYLN